MSESLKAEVFALNYNGEALLRECLPSIVEAAHRSKAPCSVTVIDNESRDGSVEMLKREFPSVKIRLSKNRVLCSFNEAVRESDADIVLLLNNDLKVDPNYPNFVDPLMDVFRDHRDAFLAAPQAWTFDGKSYEGSLTKMNFKRGTLWVKSRFPGYLDKVNTPGVTMQAGFGAYHRQIFLALGGFDDLYLPGMVEDADLCFRAWKTGRACYYVPQSRVRHMGQATFKKYFGKRRLSAINHRNYHLFMWKNITEPRLWREYLLWYFIRPFYFLLQGRPEFLWGTLWAFGRLGAALKKRRAMKDAPRRRSDLEIFRISENIG